MPQPDLNLPQNRFPYANRYVARHGSQNGGMRPLPCPCGTLRPGALAQHYFRNVRMPRHQRHNVSLDGDIGRGIMACADEHK